MLVVVFVAQASFTLVTPFLPYVLKSMNVTENLATWSGLAYSASFFFSAIMAPIWGSVADKYGKKMQILRSGVGIAITYACYPFATTPLQFVMMRGLTGFLSGFLPAATSLVATNTPEDQMGYALGLFQAMSAAGTISGPLIGGVMVQVMGIPLTFRVSAAVLMVFSVLAYVLLREDVVKSGHRINVLGDIRECFINKQLVMVFVCMFLVQAGIQVTQPTLVLYIDKLSLGRDSTLISGIVYSVAGLGTVLGATLTAKRTNGVSRLFMAGIMGSALFAALQGVWVAIIPLALFRLFFGAFNGILVVAGNVLAATAVTREFRGRAFGVMNGVMPMGSVAGPILGGAVDDSMGLGKSFYASSLVFLMAAGAFGAYTRRASSGSQPRDKQPLSSQP